MTVPIGQSNTMTLAYFCRLLIGVLAIAFDPLSASAQGLRPATDVGREVPEWLSNLEIAPDGFRLIRDEAARHRYKVSGKGIAVVVIDSGVNAEHPALAGRVLPGNSLVGGSINDEIGNGSHRAGVVAAGRTMMVPEGVAPDAKIIPVKIYDKSGQVEMKAVADALRWVIESRRRYQDEFDVTIGVVVLGIGDHSNLKLSKEVPEEYLDVKRELAKAAALGIVVCAPAGNAYGEYSDEGMAFPAICEEVISVGAVYDANVERNENQDGALLVFSGGVKVFATKRDKIAGFSQRLFPSPATAERGTDIFAPGVAIASPGARGDECLIQSGTGISASVVAGAVALLQERSRMLTRQLGEDPWLPSIELVRQCLSEGGRQIIDEPEDPPLDNVRPTGRRFKRLDVSGALRILDARYQSDVIKLRQNLISADGHSSASVLDFSILGRAPEKPIER